MRVILSCQTIEQLAMARKFAILWLRVNRPYLTGIIAMQLVSLLNSKEAQLLVKGSGQ